MNYPRKRENTYIHLGSILSGVLLSVGRKSICGTLFRYSITAECASKCVSGVGVFEGRQWLLGKVEKWTHINFKSGQRNSQSEIKVKSGQNKAGK